MKKQVLIICTSTTNNEFLQYWKQNNTEFFISNFLFIIQGYQNEEHVDKYTKIIDSFDNKEFDIYLLWHKVSSQKSELGKTNKKRTEYTCFFYTTTDNNLSDFWSYHGGEFWQVPPERPIVPLDRLCWGINKARDKVNELKDAVDGVINYFKNKGEEKERIKAALLFLHGSLGGTLHDTEILLKNGFNLSEKDVGKLSLADLLEKLRNKEKENYYNDLQKVRNNLLKQIGIIILDMKN